MRRKEKAILEKLGEFRKQEEFEDKKILSKKGKASLVHLRICARKERQVRKIAITEIES